MKSVFGAMVLAVAAWVVFEPPAHAQKQSFTIEAIRKMETRIQMPRDSVSIGNYVRYYAMSERYPGYVRGTFIRKRSNARSGEDDSSIRIVNEKDLPVVYDGGCGIVEVSFDLTSDDMIFASCHGFP